jgi:hypothetical protein
MPITTDIVSSHIDQGEVHVQHYVIKFVSDLIQHYVIKFVSDLWHVGGFSLGPPISFTNKTDHHDIAEILLEVALNTTKQTNIG